LVEASSDLAETPTNLAMSSIFTGAGSSLVRSVRALAMESKDRESNLSMMDYSLLVRFGFLKLKSGENGIKTSKSKRPTTSWLAVLVNRP
jgi:hypothetical protein